MSTSEGKPTLIIGERPKIMRCTHKIRVPPDVNWAETFMPSSTPLSNSINKIVLETLYGVTSSNAQELEPAPMTIFSK
jgi:hypothetical protein